MWIWFYKASLPPNMFLNKQACVIAPPIASRPPQTLPKELGIAFEGSSKHAFIVVLDPSLPAA
jgi:hypothetical protein